MYKSYLIDSSVYELLYCLTKGAPWIHPCNIRSIYAMSVNMKLLRRWPDTTKHIPIVAISHVSRQQFYCIARSLYNFIAHDICYRPYLTLKIADFQQIDNLFKLLHAGVYHTVCHARALKLEPSTIEMMRLRNITVVVWCTKFDLFQHIAGMHIEGTTRDQEAIMRYKTGCKLRVHKCIIPI